MMIRLPPACPYADRLTRTLGACGLVCFAYITGMCLAAQFLRSDLNWITTSLSLYVEGPYGAAVRGSFFAAALGIAGLGAGWHRALERHPHSDAAWALFIAAAIALCSTATFTTDPTQHPVTLHGAIHQWSAFGTFVFVTTAMLLQSWCLIRRCNWTLRCIEIFTVAIIAVIYFWTFALVKSIPRGLGEKVVIGLVLYWLWRGGFWLARARRATRRHT